jgi:hypothetical protein
MVSDKVKMIINHTKKANTCNAAKHSGFQKPTFQGEGNRIQTDKHKCHLKIFQQTLSWLIPGTET